MTVSLERACPSAASRRSSNSATASLSLVLSEGRQMGILDGDCISQEQVLAMATGIDNAPSPAHF